MNKGLFAMVTPSAFQTGTSGFSYTEWSTFRFYPSDTQPNQMLPVYAQQFCVTELNTTWYQMPRVESLERLQRQVTRSFRFAVKLNRRLTHEIDSRNWHRHALVFRDGIASLIQARQLAAVLISFPHTFDRSPGHRTYLSELLSALNGLPVAVEFRCASWAHERVYEELKRRKVTLSISDFPIHRDIRPFPVAPIVTNAAFFYVRFHGRAPRRNTQRQAPHSSNYNYSALELQACARELIVPMLHQAKAGFIFFCNYGQARAPQNAKELQEILHASTSMPVPPSPTQGTPS